MFPNLVILAGSSAALALVYLAHNWYKNMGSTGKVVRVSLLDFRKTCDLINHNELLENFVNIGVLSIINKMVCDVPTRETPNVSV